MPPVTGRRGSTMPELIVSLTLGALIGSAVVVVLVRHEQLATNLAQRSAGGVQLRHGRDALRGELRALAEGGAAPSRATDTTLELRSTVGVARACVDSGAAPSQIVVAAAGRVTPMPVDAWVRSIAPGDSVLLRDPADGRWHGRELASVAHSRCLLPSTREAVDGWRLSLSSASPANGAGWIVRVVRPTVWAAYRGSDRAWWLGLRELTEGRWGTVQPVMGPLAIVARPAVFAPLDRLGRALSVSGGTGPAWSVRVSLPTTVAPRDTLVLHVPLWVAP